MSLATQFPSRAAALSRWGRPQPATPEVKPPQEWIDSYLSGFDFVADVDKGVDGDADAWPNCAVFWWLMLDDAERALRIDEPWRGEDDARPRLPRLRPKRQGQSSQSAGACAVCRKAARTESTTEGQHCRSRWPSSFMGTK